MPQVSGGVDPVSGIAEWLLQMLTGKDVAGHAQTQNPLYQSLGGGAVQHGEIGEQFAQKGLPPPLGMAGGRGIEWIEAMMRNAFPVGDPRGADPLSQAAQFNKPLMEHFASPDTYKDEFSNFIGLLSGTPLVPEQIKAPIMNQLVPYTLALPSGSDFLPTSAQSKYLPSKGEK